MKKLILLLLIFSSFFFIFDSNVYATGNCGWAFTDETGKNPLPPFYKSISKINYTITLGDSDKLPNATYTVKNCPDNGFCLLDNNKVADSQGFIKGSLLILRDYHNGNPTTTHIDIDLNNGQHNPICSYPYTWDNAIAPTPSQRAECELSIFPNSNIDIGTPLTVVGTIKNVVGMTNYEQTVGGGFGLNSSNINVSGSNSFSKDFVPVLNTDNSNNKFAAALSNGYTNGNYVVNAYINIRNKDAFADFIGASCSLAFQVPGGVLPSITPTPVPPTLPIPDICIQYPINDPIHHTVCKTDYCLGQCSICPGCSGSGQPVANLRPICEQIGHKNAPGDPCYDCISKGKIWTAIGCVPTNVPDILRDYVFKWGIGLAGGIAFLYFLYGAFLVLTSMGTPEKVNEGREIMTSSIAGLLLIIFSVFILKVVGVDILRIPGFS